MGQWGLGRVSWALGHWSWNHGSTGVLGPWGTISDSCETNRLIEPLWKPLGALQPHLRGSRDSSGALVGPRCLPCQVLLWLRGACWCASPATLPLQWQSLVPKRCYKLPSTVVGAAFSLLPVRPASRPFGKSGGNAASLSTRPRKLEVEKSSFPIPSELLFKNLRQTAILKSGVC